MLALKEITTSKVISLDFNGMMELVEKSTVVEVFNLSGLIITFLETVEYGLVRVIDNATEIYIVLT